MDVVKQLWLSIEDEALIIDKENGRYLDVEKVHPVNHEGAWFKVQGALDSPTTPQGHPVIVQAGSSESGKELAAKTAEVILQLGKRLKRHRSFIGMSKVDWLNTDASRMI